MFEKIGTRAYATLSNPCEELLYLLARLKKAQRSLTVAEVGVGIGATSLRILDLLGAGDTLHLFDFQRVIDEFMADIKTHPLSARGVNIIARGNSDKTYDSFNWHFADMILQKTRAGESPQVFDAVYLDGAHTFMHTTAACCLLKKMIRPSGFLVFDDVFWTLAGYRARNPLQAETLAQGYTEEQINIPHVALVIDIFMTPDPEFRRIRLSDDPKARRAVFQRV